MKTCGAFGALALGLAASVAAHEHNKHEVFHQQRAVASSLSCNVTYVTVTSYGEWKLVPETTTSSSSAKATSSSISSSSSAAPPPPPPSSSSVAPSSSSTPPPPPPPSTSSTSSSTPPPPPPTTSSTPPPPPPTTYSAPSSSAAPQYNANPVSQAWGAVQSAASNLLGSGSGSGSGSSGSISSNGNQWAFCYTPYTSSGGCKSADEVSSDISSLKGKGFTTIRTYANDCSGLQNIGNACKAHGLKMIVGIDIDGSGIGSKTSSEVSDIASWGKGNWDMVEMVVAGNEAIFSGFVSASAMAGFISDVKSKLSSAGYSGPVTTTEPLNIIEQYGSTLCPAVDVIAANIHPFFNNAVSAEMAGGFVASQLSDLAGVCNHQKEAYCLETGWPSAGGSNGIAIPGFSDQKTAISGIMSKVGSKVAMFSFQNDNWKAPGQYGVEQNWGSSSLFN